MKIIRFDMFDRDDWHGDQYIVQGSEGLSSKDAEAMAARLNDDPRKGYDDWFVVKPDSYVLPPKWEP